MGWLYDFVDPTPDQKDQRRRTIDLFALVAHYSALVPALVFVALRLARRLSRRLAVSAPTARSPSYHQVPRSPLAKAHRHEASSLLAARWLRLQWWLSDNLSIARIDCGRRYQWALGLAWTAWLLLLCFLATDYLHLTKRFGAIAVSQLPIQQLLALKALNPFAWAFCSSHETLNSLHRLLGRIIYGLVLVHALLYNYYFLVTAIWLKRFFALVVFCGVIAFGLITALIITSTSSIRALSYRLFFITHIVSALLIPLLIFVHAPSARLYLVETLIVYFLDRALRTATAVTSPATIHPVPGTSLVKISLALPARKLARFAAAPGSHVYLSIRLDTLPQDQGAWSLFTFLFLYNPFTLASVDQIKNTLTLVARVRSGPMTTTLACYASSSNPSPAHGQLSLTLDGPYGAMTHLLDNLLRWGAARVLFFAGGVGATFIFPVYRALQAESPSAKTQLIWAVRGAADVACALPDSSAASSILRDKNLDLFITRESDMVQESENTPGGAVEMTAIPPSDNSPLVSKPHHQRPDIKQIVNDAFRQGTEERIAILVCGPADMAKTLRQSVRPWVMRGRQVWWHDENFAW
ncbi:hypothetical protein CDD82_5612 [Ophiocordyceps australis]|uniref:FAD-binding FR-type domain-containing protein n=1 Tax=Ophiocordyceps australis TaxID=1399860 RepID=A0A2C5YZJ5_9HYPO|nr:hypothetical protein CDD82_5612 [Ophiocordyceps australis]